MCPLCLLFTSIFSVMLQAGNTRQTTNLHRKHDSTTGSGQGQLCLLCPFKDHI